MRKRTKFKVRFYLLPTLLLAAFVVILASVTLGILASKFESMARDSAQALFSQVAQRNADPLQATIDTVRLTVAQQARRGEGQLFADGQLALDALVPMLVATLRATPQAYSFFHGFDDGEFLQVIGVRDDPGVLQALKAPAGTQFAVRHITAGDAGQAGRSESWVFLDDDELPLAQAEGNARYAPQSRQWFASASAAPGLHVSRPYLYDSLQELGLTLSQRLSGGKGVFGADVALRGLDAFAARSLHGLDGGLVITGPDGQVLAAHAEERFFSHPVSVLQPVRRSGNPHFAEADSLLAGPDGSRILAVQGENFAYAKRSVAISPTQSLHVVAFSPMSLYAGRIEQARDDIMLFAAITLLVCMPVVFLIARRIAGTLDALTRESKRIQRMDFSGEQPVRSVFYEIDLLGKAHHTMKRAIRDRSSALDEAMSRLGSLVDSGVKLSTRRSEEEVLRQTAESARTLAGAQAAQLWLVSEDGALRLAAVAGMAQPPAASVSRWVLAAKPAGAGANAGPATSAAAVPNAQAEPGPRAPVDPCVWVAASRQPVLLNGGEGFDLSVQREVLGGAIASLMALPVLARGDKLLGVLVLANALPGASAEDSGFDAGSMRYVQTLVAQSGSALENINLLRQHRELMEALIRLLAGAIDAKSAHTGAHCERVPELARMLAEEACEVEQGPLADFRFETEEEWAEFRIGTWLHDCGKVTTPEHVVEKATKLETLYNRIHEIRTRFEVLLRDARIAQLESVVAGADAGQAAQVFDETRARLIDDFAFVAQCNIGDESMAAERRERLRQIGQQTWLRYFDDRLGISHDEEKRLRGVPRAALPAVEPLLADKPNHVIARTEAQRYDPRHGFKMDVPENLYDFGELYNLSIERGTLTAEERYKINEHIVQTIVMLEQLPLPSSLSRVSEYAGTHHETLTGSGYPRRLRGEDLSIPARIMAIADIFEALTASDRPYKKARKLSEAVRLLATFKRKQHIDGDLFDLFLTSGVYRRYAQRYLAPEQIDDVEIGAYLG